MPKHFAKFVFVSYFYPYFIFMRNIVRTISLLSIFLLINYACKRADKMPDTMEADYIEYQVVYMEKMAGDIPTKMLPDVMEAYYSKRFIRTSIQGFFGQFSLVQIADLRQNSVTTLLNFFGNKVFYTGKKGEIPAGINELKDPTFNMTDDTLRICGMLSKRAVIETEDNTYDIYYSEDIDIKSPNITTPYHFIDHVLCDFRVQLSMLKMQLIMRHHEKKEVNSALFLIPDDYEQVSRETMESIINSLFTKG